MQMNVCILKKCRYLCIFFGWTLPSSCTRHAGQSAINAVKHAMEKAGFVAKRSAPPSGFLKITDQGLNNSEEMKLVLGANRGVLLDADGVWKGPRGTSPFWDDRDECVFTCFVLRRIEIIVVFVFTASMTVG